MLEIKIFKIKNKFTHLQKCLKIQHKDKGVLRNNQDHLIKDNDKFLLVKQNTHIDNFRTLNAVHF